MVTRRMTGVMVSMLIVGTVLVGCAKRPATTQASAPPPTGAAVATPAPPAPAPAATPAPAPAVSARPTPASPAPAPATTPRTAAPATPTPSARPAPKEFTAIPELKPIYFDFDKYDIRPGDAKILDSNSTWLKSHADYLVLIEGHCDERGTNEYNLALGERRAKATMNYLVSQGVQATRITIISYGEERPTCTEKNEACWSKNRRSQFLVKPR